MKTLLDLPRELRDTIYEYLYEPVRCKCLRHRVQYFGISNPGVSSRMNEYPDSFEYLLTSNPNAVVWMHPTGNIHSVNILCEATPITKAIIPVPQVSAEYLHAKVFQDRSITVRFKIDLKEHHVPLRSKDEDLRVTEVSNEDAIMFLRGATHLSILIEKSDIYMSYHGPYIWEALEELTKCLSDAKLDCATLKVGICYRDTGHIRTSIRQSLPLSDYFSAFFLTPLDPPDSLLDAELSQQAGAYRLELEEIVETETPYIVHRFVMIEAHLYVNHKAITKISSKTHHWTKEEVMHIFPVADIRGNTALLMQFGPSAEDTLTSPWNALKQWKEIHHQEMSPSERRQRRKVPGTIWDIDWKKENWWGVDNGGTALE
jgi:hypothetical protein